MGVTSAYFAVAGVTTPGDTVLVGYLGTDVASGSGGLAVIAFPADGSSPAAPASTIVPFPGGVPAASSVAMISSRNGMNAGLAWVDDVSGQVMVTTVNGLGMTTGAPVAASSSSGPPFSCLGFSPGKDDLTVVYYAATTALTNHPPGWIIAEANEAGSVDSTTVLGLGRPLGIGCALVSPTATGYGITWQDTEGAWLAEFVSQGMTLSSRIRTRRPPHSEARICSLLWSGWRLSGTTSGCCWRVPSTPSSGGSTAWGTAGRGPHLPVDQRHLRDDIGAPAVSGDGWWPAGGDLRRLHQSGGFLDAGRRQVVPQRGMLLAWNNQKRAAVFRDG